MAASSIFCELPLFHFELRAWELMHCSDARLLDHAVLCLLGCANAFIAPASTSVFSRSVLTSTTMRPAGSRIAGGTGHVRTNALRMSADPKNVLIVGAGPAGLLAAQHLLRRGDADAFKITIAERRADPRASEQASLRSYSLGLGVRGRASIKRG